MSHRSAVTLCLLLAATTTGCASSRSLLREPALAGGSERYAASEEEVRDAAMAAVDVVGLGLDDVIDGPDSGQTFLASRGWTFWDYGAIARVIIEPGSTAEDGTWVHVVSRLKMSTNLAGKGDYREDIFSAIHGSLAVRALPPLVLAPRVTDPMVVGTPLRIAGRRVVVRGVDAARLEIDDGLSDGPQLLTRGELDAAADLERLVREPYKGHRLLIASAVGIGAGYLIGKTYGSSDAWGYDDGGVAWAYGATLGLMGVGLGAVWGNRGRTQWLTMP